MSARRIPGRCYFCGDPCTTYWFCSEHLWAQGLESPLPEHSWWVARFTREEIKELGSGLERLPIERAETNGRRRGKTRA